MLEEKHTGRAIMTTRNFYSEEINKTVGEHIEGEMGTSTIADILEIGNKPRLDI